MRDKRRKEMAAYIARRQSATMEELREVFHVSMNTVRSDVHALVHTGAVEKVYGGVRSAVRQEVPLFTQRDSTHTGAKERIARLAETRIADGDTVYLDAGTTTLRLLECLDPAKHVTVISGNLAAAGPAYNLPRVELIVLPGLMNRRTNSAADVSTLEFLGRYRCAKAFLGASGVSPDGKLNVSSYIEYELKKLVLQQSSHTYLLVDSGKFGGESLMSYGSLSDVDEVISDAGCPPAVREFCALRGVKLTLTET